MEPVKMTSARKKKIKTLLARMNKQNQRFIIIAPPLMEMMHMTIEDDELDYLLKMGTGLHSFEQVRKISTFDDDRFQKFFDTLLRKGLVHEEIDNSAKSEYRLNAIAVGWYEAMMHYLMGKPQEKAFSEKFNDYFLFFKRFNFSPLRDLQSLVLGPFMKPGQGVGLLDPATTGKNKKKTIPIGASVSAPESKVYPTSFLNDLIEEHGDRDAIRAFPCVCRHGAKVLGKPCDFKMPRDSCIAFGDIAKSWAGYGYGRSVTKAEAMDILKEVRDKGAVHSVIHEKDDIRLPVIAICNCCWDCCGILKSYNMGAAPLKYQCFFSARIRDESACNGCGACERFCPTTAVTVKNKKAVINNAKCIGCGQCAYQCVKNTIELVPDERVVFLPTLKKSEIRITS